MLVKNPEEVFREHNNYLYSPRFKHTCFNLSFQYDKINVYYQQKLHF